MKRKIESIWCKKGRGNSYVVTAYDIGADGKIDRTKETECRIDETLLSLPSKKAVKRTAMEATAKKGSAATGNSAGKAEAARWLINSTHLFEHARPPNRHG